MNARADPYRAHSKGVQLFDATSGYWIIHSIPKYPPIDAPYNYPNSATRNGQSIMCISMQTSQLKDICNKFCIFTSHIFLAFQLKIYQLNIYSSSLPTSMAQNYRDLADVISRKKIRHWSKYSNVANIVSNDGMLFVSFAKHKKWAKGIRLITVS
jgi:deoxyribonuclease-2